MKNELKYVELKSGHGDCGPAWVGFSNSSKSGSTIYFNGKAFKSLRGSGISGNYYETETGDEYWISGVKKNNQDRHWAGGGNIKIDCSAIKPYLALLGLPKLPRNFEPADLAPSKPNAMFHEMENMVLEEDENQGKFFGRRRISKLINKP